MANSLREVSEKETIKITEFRIVLNHIKKASIKNTLCAGLPLLKIIIF